MLAGMHDALNAKDADGLKRIAHTLKGSASSLGGTEVARIALELEAMGRGNYLVGADDLLGTLDHALTRLERELLALSGSGAA